jgi:predicted RNA-binding protein with PIN domain
LGGRGFRNLQNLKMKLTKTFNYLDSKNRDLIIEFELFGEIDPDEDDVIFDDHVVLSVFDEENQEEVVLEDVDEIIEEYIEKNYKKLARQITLE